MVKTNTVGLSKKPLGRPKKTTIPVSPKSIDNSKISQKKVIRSVKTRLLYDDENIIPIKQNQIKSITATSDLKKPTRETDKPIQLNQDQGQEYEVEAILNFDPDYKKTCEAHFEVKWKNYKK